MEKISPIVTGLVGGGIAYLVMRWSSRGKTPAANGSVLKFSFRMRGVALVCLAIALFIGYAALHASPDQRLLAYGLSGAFLVGTIWFIGDVFFFEARLSERGIDVRSPWRRNRSFAWGDFVAYEYSNTNNWHILITRSKERLRLSEHLGGVERVLAKLDPELIHAG